MNNFFLYRLATKEEITEAQRCYVRRGMQMQLARWAFNAEISVYRDIIVRDTSDRGKVSKDPKVAILFSVTENPK